LPIAARLAVQMQAADALFSMRLMQRRLWPVILISSALLLLTAGIIALSQLYWIDLQGGLVRMRIAINETNRQQIGLADQMRAARLALQKREAELERREAELERREAALQRQLERIKQGYADSDRVQSQLPASRQSEVEVTGVLKSTLNAVERQRIQLLLANILQAAARLPPLGRMQQRALSWPAKAPLVLKDHRPLKAQVQVAEAALLMGDPVLLELTAVAGQRLLIEFYAPAMRHGNLDGQLRHLNLLFAELRAVLRAPPN
jgi:hypothetical protein